MNRLSSAIFALLVLACQRQNESDAALKPGMWRGVINIQNQELPFNFEVEKDQEGSYDIYLRNAEERILLDEVSVNGDSVDIGLHVFDANIKALMYGDSLKGVFVKNYEKNYRIPFAAAYGQSFRFPKENKPANVPDFGGKYEVTFVDKSDTTLAIGVFRQEGDSVTGTFLTPTGDYRYLQGSVINGTMHLSTFDGNHAYLFKAVKGSDGTLSGEYYSGKTHMEFWTARKNEQAALPDAESLTYLKEGYDRITFSFPDVNGKIVTLDDQKYRGKVVILQLFGTWCPNCMDETKFLAPWYEQNKGRGIEIIGLAYERKDNFQYASDRVRKMISKWNVSYDFVIAGTNDKAKASETLPMLNKVAAFPTTIFIGKDGKVKKIHTGFSGPGTGPYYDEFVEEFNETVNELLGEKLASRN
ncbi:MAG TPA: TlpA disulfide reductase family protein [Chryseosolibacter sp.]|nr:TlpA disulfide reductase family protein [Chryseosolibacter sp.]